MEWSNRRCHDARVQRTTRALFPPVSGEVIIAGAGLHSVMGLLSTEGSIADLVRKGWVGSMNPGYSPASGETFWFTFTGLALLGTGFLARTHLRVTGTLPVSFGWSLTLFGVLMSAAMPASGGWLILAIGLLALAIRPAEKAASYAAHSTSRPEYRTAGR